MASDEVARSSSVSMDITLATLRFDLRLFDFPVDLDCRPEDRLVVGVSAQVESCSSDDDEIVTLN